MGNGRLSALNDTCAPERAAVEVLRGIGDALGAASCFCRSSPRLLACLGIGSNIL
ncbi:hypothetical protein YPPY100_1307 [Yersinia pestis PY-100]|nr:hypothetical protein YPPY100_1307 [Yersinia pestis PY-100]EIT58770.1 hypothetical protein YPPY102_1319 [Yersinia pestis PY-102]